MNSVYVQFESVDETAIVSIFKGPQDPLDVPNYGVVKDDDARYLAFSEPVAVPLPESTEVAARAWRDAEILRVTWLRDRHRDEVEIGEETTLTAEQYTELLAYIKALRDWPATSDFPSDESRPVVPEWVASQTQ